MSTFTALTTLPNRAKAEALCEALERLIPEPVGTGIFEIEDGSGRWEVGAHFSENPDETGLAILSAAFGSADFAVSELPEVDWVAHVRRELHPVEAGQFFVYGSHDADKVPEGRIALLIEAAMAFGTGHHGTTLGCLRALDRIAIAGVDPRSVVDIGCGTAVLAMAAASVWPDRLILASDIDGQAVDVARANVRANGLSDRITCIEAAGFDHPVLASAAPYDLIIANILKGPLIDLAPLVGKAIAANGRVVLSGLLATQADEVTACYAAQGLVVETREEIAEWATLTLKTG